MAKQTWHMVSVPLRLKKKRKKTVPDQLFIQSLAYNFLGKYKKVDTKA